jgi:hypothetical protein
MAYDTSQVPPCYAILLTGAVQPSGTAAVLEFTACRTLRSIVWTSTSPVFVMLACRRMPCVSFNVPCSCIGKSTGKKRSLSPTRGRVAAASADGNAKAALAREFGMSRDAPYRYGPVKKRRAGKLGESEEERLGSQSCGYLFPDSCQPTNTRPTTQGRSIGRKWM